MAAAILASAVLAVTWAVTAGQQQAEEARTQIVATLMAEEWMGAASADPYSALPDNDGTVPNGEFWMTTIVNPAASEVITPLGVKVECTSIEVMAQDQSGKVIARLKQTIPAPPS